MPSYIKYLEAVQTLEKNSSHVRVSDISDALGLPRPGVTRTVGEMEAKGYLKKCASDQDGRVTYILITEEGRNLWKKYDEQYFATLSPYMDGISEEEAEQMIHTIEKFYQVMRRRRNADDE